MILESEGDIHRADDENNEMLRISEMKLNSRRTMILVCTRNPQIKTDVYISIQILDQVNEMVYLGSRIPSNSKSIKEIKQCIGLAKTDLNKKKLFTSKKINLNIKKKLTKTYV